MDRSKLLFLTFFSLITSLFFGEGTKQLRPTEADDGYINLMDTQNGLGTERTFALYTSTDETRLNIRISDPQTEVIYLGFRTFSNDDLFYRIKAPDGTIVVPETAVPMNNGDPGRIIDYDEAIAGPNTIDAAGYLPILFDPAATNQAGDYSIEFRDPEHNPATNDHEKRKFELFDITVVQTTTNTAIAGRLWSKSWDLTTNASNNQFNGSTFIYTNDGITTKAQFDGFQPWSFIIQSNSTGPANTGVVENDRQSILGGILLPDYKIFLTEPDPIEFPISELPMISGLPNLDICTSSSNYCINIELSNPGIIEYVIDIDGAPGFDHVRDVKLIAEVIAGENCLPWDGLDGQGNPLTTLDVFDIILSYQTGVTHLFIHDAEDNPNGFNVEHISPGSANTPQLFYDDSNISGTTDLNGCSLNCHIWDSDFGNNETINTWWVTFLEDDTIKDLSINASLVKSEVDIIIAEPVACGGNQMTLEANNILNAGASSTLTWQVNNIDRGTGNTFVVTNINEGDSIKLILTSSEICIQPDTSIIVVAIPKTPSVSNDTTVCVGDSVVIIASDIAADFRWLLGDTEFSLDSIDTVYADITRTYTAEVTYQTPSVDLINNGDFEAGNTGFTTDYTFTTANIGNGKYKIVTNPQEGLTVFYDMSDHTSGSGNMLLVDGNTVDGSVVYSTTVNVEIGTVYNFSAWATSVYRRNAPNLQFLVNGVPLNSLLLDLLPRWTQFNTHWMADLTGPIEIKIVNRNIVGIGNDFALDDIIFGPVATCTNSVEVAVANPLITTADIKTISPICSGDSLLLEVFDTTNIGLSPTYEWSINGTVQTTNDDSITLHNLTDNDSISVITTSSLTGCIVNSDTSFVNVSISSKPEITISGNPICREDTALITTSITGATGTPSYVWTPNNFILDATSVNIEAFPQSDTEYQVIVTDINNCKDTATYDLVINNKPEVSISGSSACAGDSVLLTSSVSNQSDPISYLWSPTTALSSSTLGAVKAAPTTDTDYRLFIEDDNGCKDTASYTISIFSSLGISIDIISPICEGDTATLTTSINTTNPVTYSWTPNNFMIDDSSEDVKVFPNTDTEYQVIAESADGCKDTATYNLVILSKPEVSISNDIICNGDTASLTATITGGTSGSTDYEWTPNNSIVNPSLNIIEAFPKSNTDYQVIVTDGNGCKDTATYVLVVLERPTVSIAPENPICEGDTTTLITFISTINPIIYSWTPSTSIIDATRNNAQVFPKTTTEYQVIAENTDGCTDTATYNLVVFKKPTVSILPANSICSGDTAVLTTTTDAIGSPSYIWTPNDSIVNPSLNEIEAFPESNTDYQVILTDDNGCIDTANYTLVVNKTPSLSFSGLSVCSGDTTTLTAVTDATGLPTYTWTPDESIIDPSLGTVEAFPKSNTDYQLLIKDINGCENTASYSLIIFIKPEVSINGGNVCDGLTAELVSTTTNFTSPLTHTWSPAANLNVIDQGTVIASPSIDTEYTLIVEDGNGCKDTESTTVLVASKSNPSLNLTQDSTICRSETLTIEGRTLSGGAYQWYKDETVMLGETDSILDIKEAGKYYLLDDNGCPAQSTDTIEIIFDEVPTAKAGQSLDIGETDFATLDGSASTDQFVWSIISSESGVNIILDPDSLTSLINTAVGNSGKYELKLCASSNLGVCPQACDSITVLIRGALYAPNVFTPSGDGINETFVVKGIKDYPEAVISIINRWGNVVYETDNYSENEWDGGQSPSGVYFYIIDLGGDDKDDNFSGVVHILK